MYTIHELGHDTIYIALSDITDNIHNWINKNIPNPNWGIINSVKVGIFLKKEDASAFVLTFIM
jgi:hypothetical protein